MISNTKLVSDILALRIREAMQRTQIDEAKLSQETNITETRLRPILAGECESTTFFEIIAFAVTFGQSVDSLLN